MVYGGQDVVDIYADDPTVMVNGPGRTKILITADRDWRDHIDLIVDSIANLGGMACVNTTAVLYEGDPAPLARRSPSGWRRSSRCRARTSARSCPPSRSTRRRRWRTIWRPRPPERRRCSVPIRWWRRVGDGYAALRPAVHVLAEPGSGKLTDTLNVELPFPCVWVSPWSRDAGIEPLRNRWSSPRSPATTTLIDDLLAEPTVTNVYSGNHPTYYSAPGIPHDGFLADVLMRNKGFIGD